MTNKEALNVFEQELVGYEACSQWGLDLERAMQTAIEALEKQIPKKPIKNSMSDYEYHTIKCPLCRQEYYEEDNNLYCCNCGQALDWSDVE